MGGRQSDQDNSTTARRKAAWNATCILKIINIIDSAGSAAQALIGEEGVSFLHLTPSFYLAQREVLKTLALSLFLSLSQIDKRYLSRWIWVDVRKPVKVDLPVRSQNGGHEKPG